MRVYPFLWVCLSRLGWALFGILAAGLYLYFLQSRSMPDLEFWHRESLAAEVVPELDRLSEVSLQQYIAHEDRIFQQLDKKVDDSTVELPTWHRYNEVAHAVYRAGWPQGNKTQHRIPDNKVGAALLVHGLSDSTHSMRAVADDLFETGFQTLNLRMPGHGTLPGALQNVTWRQFRAAYQLGVRSLAQDLAPGQPLVLVGYSNGAALAVDYTLRALLAEGTLPMPDLLILISPAMQVSPVAAYARIQRWISELPGMEKLGWTDVVPEFDPFKYNSFPVYAGEQIYRLTTRLAKNLDKLSAQQRGRFPPLLAFQSVVDATIPPLSILHGLLDKLDGGNAELVLFDVNRTSSMLPLLVNRGEALLDTLQDRPLLPFDLTLVGSASLNPEVVSIRQRGRGGSTWHETATDMRWPNSVYSLSHVALPFDANDPIYGPNKSDGLLRLGELWFKGERGVFGVPLGMLARQRYNPFYPYLQRRVVDAAKKAAKPE
jgi:alpha-beta hydrolase superfamily lysophospholipase